MSIVVTAPMGCLSTLSQDEHYLITIMTGIYRLGIESATPNCKANTQWTIAAGSPFKTGNPVVISFKMTCTSQQKIITLGCGLKTQLFSYVFVLAAKKKVNER